MRRSLKILTVCLLSTAAVPASANMVVNGSFETGDFTGWNQVNDTSFTFVTDEMAGGGPTDGVFHAAFGPTDPGGGGILQSVATTVGAQYRLTFDIANLGNPPNAYGVYWDGGFVDLQFDNSSFNYTSMTLDLTATSGSTQFGFIFYNEPSFYLLDNVSLLGAVPEPSTWAMMILGFGVIGGAARRRNVASRVTLA